MQTKKYKYFVAIVQAGNISKAAKILNISQPPLSAYIKQLEKEIGVKLIVRGSRYIKLTPEGEYYYDIAKKILAYEEQIDEELINNVSLQKRPIKIGVISSVTDIVMESLSKLDKSIKYSIIEGNTYQLIDKIKSNNLDLAIVRTPYIVGDFQYRKIIDDTLCFYGNHEDIQINNIYELSNKPLVIYRRWETVLKNKFQQANVNTNFVMICDDARTCIAAADNNIGITIIPRSIPTHRKEKTVIPFDLASSSIHIIKTKNNDNTIVNYIYNSIQLSI